MKYKISKLLVGLLVLLVIATGSVYLIKNKTNKNSNQKFETVSFRLNWFPDASMAPILVAKDKGFFTKEGLNVKINNGGPDINTVNLIASGSDDIGLASTDAQVLVAQSQGTPIKMVGVMWSNPVAFVAKKSSGIKSPKDFEGKKVANYTYSPQNVRTLETMVKKDGGDPSKIKIEPFDFTYKTFIDDKVDGANIYLSDQLNTLRSKGIDMNVFVASDYGVNHYGGPIIVKNETLKNNPEMVEKVLKGIQEGVEYTESHPQEAAKVVIAYNDQYTTESLIGNFKDIAKYQVYVKNLEIKSSVIKDGYDYLVQTKQITTPYNWKESYTNSLLSK